MAKGNTIGKIVGETPAAKVAAKEANPPVPVRAAEEGLGTQLLDGTQLVLDVAGVVPGLGIIPDVANAGISALRGDWVGAGLSLAAAIPFAGWGATAAKVGRKGAAAVAKQVEKKAAKEVTEKATEKAAKEKLEKEAAEKLAREKAEKEAAGKAEKKEGDTQVKKKEAGPCDHLRQGKGKGPYRGGAHSKTSKPANDGKDSHHMPADDVSPLKRNDGPAIQMDPADHKLTSSNGSSREAIQYRQMIENLLKDGKWRDALAIEIKDVRQIAKELGNPKKYNEATLEMLEYFKCLEKNSLLPKG